MAKTPYTPASRAKAAQNPHQTANLRLGREELLRRLWAEHAPDGSAL